MTIASKLESPRRGADAEHIASFVNGVDPRRLKSHVWRCILTCIVSLLGVAGAVLFIARGPQLGGASSIFVSFLLVTFVSLFAVGILSIMTPILSLFAYQRLARGQVDLDNLDLQEELEAARAQLIKSATIFRELCSAPQAELEGVLKQHEEEIAELSQWK
jgi:hypothetical protein